MSIGRKKFNMDPKKGIEYLIEHGLLKNTPEGELQVEKFICKIVQQSGRRINAPLGIMGDQLRAPLKPPVRLCSMVPMGVVVP